MGKHIGTGGLARGKILGRLAFYTWVPSRPLTYHSSMSCQKKIDDVDTLEKLRKTGSYFDQLISGRFITTLDLPSPLDFINVVAASSRLEKKPLLKIRCKKSDKQFILYFSDYILDCQLAFIFLDKKET